MSEFIVPVLNIERLQRAWTFNDPWGTYPWEAPELPQPDRLTSDAPVAIHDVEHLAMSAGHTPSRPTPQAGHVLTRPTVTAGHATSFAVSTGAFSDAFSPAFDRSYDPSFSAGHTLTRTIVSAGSTPSRLS